MADKIISTQTKVIADIIAEQYQPQSLTVIDHSVIQDRIVTRFARNCENYVLARMPENIYNGIADIMLLHKLVGLLFDKWVPAYVADPTNVSGYVTGSIAKGIESVGSNLTQTVKLFSLIKTKAAINNTVDIANSFTFDPFLMNRVMPNIDKEFVNMLLTDPATRMTVLNRIKAVAVPAPSQVTADDIGTLSALIATGRGEAVPPEYYPAHMAVRSMVLVLLRTMVEVSRVKPELAYDILPAYSLLILYTNITENEQVYDTAFPAIAVVSNNNVYLTKTMSTLKQLAMMFTKLGFVGKSFNGVIATRLLKEYFTVFEGMFKADIWREPVYDATGKPVISFTGNSFIEQNTVKFEAATKVFDEVLPSMFKGYTEEVISEIKTAAGCDHILTKMADLLPQVDEKSIFTTFPDLSTLFRSLPPILNDPEGVDSFPAHAVTEVRVIEVQNFILKYIFPTTEAIYMLSVAVKQAYDRVLAAIGTPTGGIIPGVNVELEVMELKSNSDVPKLDSMNSIPYQKLTEIYAFPFAVPKFGLQVDNNNNVIKTQAWPFGHLKHKFIRPAKIFAEWAFSGDIVGLSERRPKLALSAPGLAPSPFERWSWVPSSLPLPSYLNYVGFASTPIPYNYTADTVFDYINNKADKVEQMMTRTGRNAKAIPALTELDYAQVLTAYYLNGTVIKADLALAVAGLGFIYEYQETTSGKGTWKLILPNTPTIYGMPTSIMIYANQVELSSEVTLTDQGIIFNDMTSDLYNRSIYDRKLRRPSVGSVILVLHDKIPTPRRLKFFMANLRNGFNVKVPFYADIFAALTDHAIASIQTAFSGEKLTPDTDTMARTTYYDMMNVFSSTLATYLVAPEIGFNKKASKSTPTREFYDVYLAPKLKLSFEDFVLQNFEKVLGWSPVITAYPHLTMSSRFEELSETHLKDIFRPLSSKLYFSDALVASKEMFKIMSVAPNDIEIMSSRDEVAWLASTENEISEISTVVRKVPRDVRRSNVTSDEMADLYTDLPIKQSKGEGSVLDMSEITKEEFQGGHFQKAEVAKTIEDIVDLDKDKDNKSLAMPRAKTSKSHREGKDEVIEEQFYTDAEGVKRPLIQEKGTDIKMSPSDQTQLKVKPVDEEEEIKAGKNKLGDGINLDKGPDENKKVTGEGDADNKKKKKSKKDEDDSDDLDN